MIPAGTASPWHAGAASAVSRMQRAGQGNVVLVVVVLVRVVLVVVVLVRQTVPTRQENSDVSPFTSVAVAVPLAASLGSLTGQATVSSNVTCPFASAV